MNEPNHLQAVALLLTAALTSSAPNQARYSHNQGGLLAFESFAGGSWIDPPRKHLAQSPQEHASGTRDLPLQAGHAHHRQPAKG